MQLTYQAPNFTDVRYFFKKPWKFTGTFRYYIGVSQSGILESAFPFQLLVQKNYCNDTCQNFGDTNTRAFYGVF